MISRRTGLAAALLLAATTLAPMQVIADETEDAIAFVKQGGDEMLAILGEPAGQTRREDFHAWLRETFDLDTLGVMALGPYSQSATAEQQAAYDTAFADYIVVTYEARFDTFTGYSFQVGRGQPLGDTDVVVRTNIIDPSGKPVVVDFRVRRAGASFQVIDVAVEGLSMLKTQRDEFTAVLQRSGMDGLIQSLNERTADVTAANG